MLVIIIITAALFLKKIRDARSAEVQRQRLHSQSFEKSTPAAVWVPKLKLARVPETVLARVPEVDFKKDCQNIQQCLSALAGKYSLDSFTIATSDGLVLASSGGETAQVDAAHYSRYNNGKDPAGMTLFGLNHKGSELTGIIRSPAGISPETRKRIENDTKDILNRWI